MKKNIALVHYSGPPVIAGVENMMREHCNYFVKFGHKPYVVVGEGEVFNKNVPVKIIKEMDSRQELPSLVRSELENGIVSNNYHKLESTIYNKIKKIIVEEKINVVIIHNVLSMHFNLALTGALYKLSQDPSDVKFISWIHDSSYKEIKNGYDAYRNIPIKLFNHYPWNLLKEKIKNVTYITISKTRYDELKNIFGYDMKIISNGVDPIKLFNLDKQMQELVQDLKLEEVDIVGCLPARAVSKKNIELAIDIISEIKKRGKKVKFLITGAHRFQRKEAAKYFTNLKKLIKTKNLSSIIYFLSDYKLASGEKFNIHNLKIFDLYCISDFLLFPSKIEGFGLPLLEAALAKTPIFCSNIATLKELGQKDAYYFKLNDNPQKIALMIIKELEYDKKSRFYRRTIKNYSWDNIFNNKIIPLVEN